MESTRKLSNFTFEGAKTLYQNNLKNIAFFFYFSRAIDVRNNILVICNITKENFLWEPKKINVKFHNCENTGRILKICDV